MNIECQIASKEEQNETAVLKTREWFLVRAVKYALGDRFFENLNNHFPTNRQLWKRRNEIMLIAFAIKYGEWRLNFLNQFYSIKPVEELLKGSESMSVWELLYVLFIATRRD